MIVWIPIKPNSKRAPGKNFRLLGGKPLYRWCLEKAVQIEGVKRVIVWSSCLDLDLPKGCEHVYRTRDFETTKASSREYYAEFASRFPSHSYLRLTVTNPFVSLETYQAISAAVRRGADSAIAVVQLQGLMFDHKLRELNHKGHWDMAASAMKPYYFYKPGVDAYTSQLLHTGRFIGEKPFTRELTAIEAIDIDYEDDWQLAETVARGLAVE